MTTLVKRKNQPFKCGGAPTNYRSDVMPNRIPWSSFNAAYPHVYGSDIYDNKPHIYPFDLPYMNKASLIRGDFRVEPPTVNTPRVCAYSCQRPYDWQNYRQRDKYTD